MDMMLRSLLRDLICAAEQNDRAQVELLLSNGLLADMSAGWPGRCAFRAAVESGHLEMVRFLITHVRHPDLTYIGNNTPLSYVIHELHDVREDPNSVARQNWWAIMECLLEAGADPRASSCDQEPLVLSRLYGMEDVEAILKQYVV
jgi:ankyrin repeat protein